jgi:glycerate kinase
MQDEYGFDFKDFPGAGAAGGLGYEKYYNYYI